MRTDGPEPRRIERPREAEEALRAVGEAIEKARRKRDQQEGEREEEDKP